MRELVTEHRRVSQDVSFNRRYMAKRLGFGTSFDIIIKDIELAGHDAFLIGIDGFIKDEIILRVVEDLRYRLEEQDVDRDLIERLLDGYIPYQETSAVKSLDDATDKVLAGGVVLFVDGCEKAILIDARTYPGRNPEEPDLEKVVRGPRDGFTETLVFNTTLVRRRVRDPELRVELVNVGRRSKTDVAILYIGDIADPDIKNEIKGRIENIDVDGLPMAEKSLEEFVTGKDKWLNPFPTVRYTERPDIVAAHLFEGHIVILTDTTPVAMIMPVTFFHHIQHAEEYHQDAIVGGYLRWVRIFGMLMAWFGPALWVALVLEKPLLPKWLQFIGPKTAATFPIFLQFILAMIGVDLIRMALIHTPNALSTSLGVIGTVLLGQLAVQVGLFTNEVILYATIAALGQFVIPSMELGMTVRLFGLGLLVLAGFFKIPGFVLGTVLTLFVLGHTKSVGVPYLYPLVPLKPRELFNVLIRRPKPSYVRRPEFLETHDPSKK